jgi:hypothetical protein
MGTSPSINPAAPDLSPATPRPDDPRIALGLTVEPHVVGPFSVRGATRTSPDEGGTLDCGLLGYVTGGRPVVFGEIWAACPSGTHEKVRLDVRAVAERIVSLLNAYDPEALARLTRTLENIIPVAQAVLDTNRATNVKEWLTVQDAARAALAGAP